MTVTDTIADLIVRLKAAILRRKDIVDLPASKVKFAIASLLKEEGFISNCEEIVRGNKKQLRIRLKYGLDQYGKPKYSAITDIKRVSRPGCRIYRQAGDLNRLMGGFGAYVISTSKGLKTDASARREKLGGEVLLKIW